MRHLQFSLYHDKESTDSRTPAEEREKVASGMIGTVFARKTLPGFMASLGFREHGYSAAAVARAVGAGSVEMLVLQTKLEKAYERHERCRLDLGDIDRAQGDAAKTVSDALLDTGHALQALVASGNASPVTKMILHNIPRCESYLREQQHPFPEQMALVLAAQFTVKEYRAWHQAKVDRETIRRCEDPVYRREQATLEYLSKPVEEEPGFGMRSRWDSDGPGSTESVSAPLAENNIGPQSNRELARQNLRPFAEVAPLLLAAKKRMEAAESTYPDALRETYLAKPERPAMFPDQDAARNRGELPADIPRAPLDVVLASGAIRTASPLRPR